MPIKLRLIGLKRPGDVQVKHTRKSSTFSSFFFCFGAELLDFAGSSSLRAPRWRASGVSQSHCHREACTRDGNKVSGQRNCATARGRSTTFCAASTTIYTASILHVDRMLICKKFYLSLFQLVLLCRFIIAVALLFEFCLELKSVVLNGYFQHQKHAAAI